MPNTVKLPSSIKTVTISALLMGDERMVMLQSKILGTQQRWTIIQLPAGDVVNERELSSFAFMNLVQVIDERYWKVPEVKIDAAMAYIALRPYDSVDHRYHNTVLGLIGDELFNAYYCTGRTLKLSDHHVRNITSRLNHVEPDDS